MEEFYIHNGLSNFWDFYPQFKWANTGNFNPQWNLNLCWASHINHWFIIHKLKLLQHPHNSSRLLAYPQLRKGNSQIPAVSNIRQLGMGQTLKTPPVKRQQNACRYSSIDKWLHPGTFLGCQNMISPTHQVPIAMSPLQETPSPFWCSNLGCRMEPSTAFHRDVSVELGEF